MPAAAEFQMSAEANDERERSRSPEQPVLRDAETLGSLIDREERLLGGGSVVAVGGDESCSHRALHGAELRQQCRDPARRHRCHFAGIFNQRSEVDGFTGVFSSHRGTRAADRLPIACLQAPCSRSRSASCVRCEEQHTPRLPACSRHF